MHGALGAKVGEGATAHVHAWAPGRVVKLLKAGLPQRLIAHEARMTRAAFMGGVPAPEVFETVVVDGRFGFVMSHLDGPTLMEFTKRGAIAYAAAGAVLADLLHAVHRTPPPPEAPSLRDYMAGGLRRAGDAAPPQVVSGVLAALDRLAPGDGLCHGDPHTGNVIMTADGARFIDWTGAMRAPAVLDLASAHVFLSELAPAMVADPERPRAVNAALQAAYAGLAGMSAAALAAAAAPYLPIVRMLVLIGGAAPAHRTRLLQALAADFPG